MTISSINILCAAFLSFNRLTSCFIFTSSISFNCTLWMNQFTFNFIFIYWWSLLTGISYTISIIKLCSLYPNANHFLIIYFTCILYQWIFTFSSKYTSISISCTFTIHILSIFTFYICLINEIWTLFYFTFTLAIIYTIRRNLTIPILI
jgi:hypothetical protein